MPDRLSLTAPGRIALLLLLAGALSACVTPPEPETVQAPAGAPPAPVEVRVTTLDGDEPVAPLATGEEAPADAPQELGAMPELVVANTLDASVSLVDLKSLSERRRLRVGQSPYAVAFNADATLLAIGVEGEGKVRFWKFPELVPAGEVHIGQMHHDHMVLSRDGKHFLLANYHGDAIVGIDVRSKHVAFRIPKVSGPHVAKYDPKGERLFVTCKQVTGIGIIEPDKRQLVAFHPTNVNPRSLTFSPDGRRVYFGSFWVDGFFEMDAEKGEVTRLISVPPPTGSKAQEVTYHGIEYVEGGYVIAANEGRSYVDSVAVDTGELADRLRDVDKPCCIEELPSTAGQSARRAATANETSSTRIVVSNVGNATLQLVAVGSRGRLSSLGKISVGGGPKRVAFVPVPRASAESSAPPGKK